jgi:hypothetical protein
LGSGPVPDRVHDRRRGSGVSQASQPDRLALARHRLDIGKPRAGRRIRVVRAGRTVASRLGGGAAWFLNWSLALLFSGGLLLFLLLLFPNGQPLTPRWRAVGWLGVGFSLVYLLIIWLDPVTLGVAGLPSLPNPTGIAAARILVTRGSVLGVGAFILSLGCLVLAAASVFVRYRRSAGDERLQLKWFAYAAVLSLALVVVLIPLSIVTESGQVLFAAAVVAGIGLALPVAIGTAILKYRLYAIDRIISRTVSYALVTGLVVGIYLGCVALLTKALPFRGSVGIAAAVLAAAALFNPLRRRVQAAVDRRFNRTRYDAERVVARFSLQLREEVDLDVLGADLLGVVHQVLAPAHMALWLSGEASSPGAPDGAPPSAPGGQPAGPRVSAGR